MRFYYLVLVFVVAGIGLWAVRDGPNDQERMVEPLLSARDAERKKPSNQTDTWGELAKRRAAEPRQAPSIRDVSVFDGEFNVRVHSFNVLREFMPGHDVPIADYYDSLAQLAHAGDTNAALELTFALMHCVGYATTKVELTDRINKMHQTHLVASPSRPEPLLVEDIYPWIEIEQQRYEVCKGLSKEQVAGYYDWFDLAAKLGDYFAQAGAIEWVLDRYWRTHGLGANVQGFEAVVHQLQMLAETGSYELGQSIEHLKAAREQGSIQALHDLALLYSADIVQPQNGYSATANAYANLRAASEVWQQIWGPGSYTYGKDLSRLSDRLRPYELSWAEGRARSILRDANCCRNP